MTTEVVFGGDSTDIPPGSYPAHFKSIEVKTSDAYGEFRAWDFELASGSIVGGSTSMSMNAKSKGGRWAAAIMGRVPAKGEKVDMADRPCIVNVIEDANGWPKVADVLPPLSGPKAAEAKDEPPVQGDADELPF